MQSTTVMNWRKRTVEKIVKRIKQLDLERAILRAVDSKTDTGFCLLCGVTREGVPFEAKQYRCGACAEKAVYSAEVLLEFLEV